MNKTELVEKIAAGAGISKVDAKKALDATVVAIKDALAKGDKIALVGFGTFSVSERPAREGINPLTKQKIKIAAKKVAKFKAGGDPFQGPHFYFIVGRLGFEPGMTEPKPVVLPLHHRPRICGCKGTNYF